MLELIHPNWPAPAWVHAYTTTRYGGFSPAPFDSLNLAMHVGDNTDCVTKNRQLLQNFLGLTESLIWLNQVHGNTVISADTTLTSNPTGDAIYSKKSNTVCAILTADCLPLLVCSPIDFCVVAIHAGWKGLNNNIIEKTIFALACPPRNLLVWLGPAIGPQAFVVGREVLQTFIEKDPATQTAFHSIGNNRWLANLYILATQRLRQLGIDKIYGGNYCTFTDHKRFFSYRRNKITGRMLSLIWLQDP